MICTTTVIKEHLLISGNLEDIILERTIDVFFVRGAKAKEYCDVLPNFYSAVLGPGAAKYHETLMTNPTLSNSYCGGLIVKPGMHHWFEHTTGQVTH